MAVWPAQASRACVTERTPAGPNTNGLPKYTGRSHLVPGRTAMRSPTAANAPQGSTASSQPTPRLLTASPCQPAGGQGRLWGQGSTQTRPGLPPGLCPGLSTAGRAGAAGHAHHQAVRLGGALRRADPGAAGGRAAPRAALPAAAGRQHDHLPCGARRLHSPGSPAAGLDGQLTSPGRLCWAPASQQQCPQQSS